MSDFAYTNIQLNSILESGGTANPFDEISTLVIQVDPAANINQLRKIHYDIAAIFSGKYPGFVLGKDKYHDLRHTYSVALATIRLLHGLHHDNRPIDAETLFLGLLSSYFHDTGMQPQSTDNHQPNSNYSKNHEERSIAVLKRYLHTNSMGDHLLEKCALIIKYTNLDWEPSADLQIDAELHFLGQVVGTADLLAQMADRYYLESLPLLYHEHQDSGTVKHSSAIDLMSSTLAFHENVIQKRLTETLGNLAPTMQSHFRERWGIDSNIYLDNIDLNLAYLKKITRSCSLDMSCWGKFLRRNPPTADL